MARNFKNAGHDVVVATGIHRGSDNDAPENGIKITRFEITGSPALSAGFVGEGAAYQKFLVETEPDLIVCHCWNTWCSELLVPVIPQVRAKTLLVSHGYSAHLLNPAILPRGLWKWLMWLPIVCALPVSLRRFDFVVFLSGKTNLGRYFDTWMAKATRCANTRIIPNGIDTSTWRDIAADFRENHHLGSGVFFLCVANYFPGKNQMMALDAFTEANIPGSLLVFIGSSFGEYGQRVRNHWDQKRGQHPSLDVRFFEKLDRQQVVAATKSCDVAILASKTEAQPLTILEAMACGKPFVCTDVGCVSEFKGGIIARNISEMAEAMSRLASDSSLRARLGNEAKRDFDDHYDVDVTHGKWRNLLEEISMSLRNQASSESLK